ncbi:hypothetical protein LJC61_04090 [Ruminococcaceae bacterium OttesenSCG-928-A16]|nr:hypothetical protein [Ruminococcaceae bacterium OttesenSCG-928-A16]
MLTLPSFHIEIEKLNWKNNDVLDDPNDFCLHGDVTVTIGNETFYHDGPLL